MKSVTAENILARISQIENAISTMPGGFSLSINHEFELACLRELLSCLQSEAVAWTDAEELRDAKESGSGYLFDIGGAANKFSDPRRQVMLYTSPQPAPVDIPKMLTPIQASRAYCGEVRGYRDGWNACRSELLAAKAEPSSDEFPPDEIECDICGHVSNDPEGRHHCCEDNSDD